MATITIHNSTPPKVTITSSGTTSATLWGTIGGDIEKQKDLMNKLSETASGATEPIPADFINNLT